jgi:hypothetical protein
MYKKTLNPKPLFLLIKSQGLMCRVTPLGWGVLLRKALRVKMTKIYGVNEPMGIDKIE